MLAIIPARGGSKGLPGKNIKNLLGLPLIVYTIRAAQQCKAISRVIVSTDSTAIAAIAKEAGAEIPFLRPDYLATDDSIAVDTYLYTCERLMAEERITIESFVVLQPTSPLRTAEDIDEAICVFKEKKADSVIAMCELFHPLEWIHTVNGDGYVRPTITDSLKNRQDYKKYLVPNGAILVLRYDLLKKSKTYYGERTVPYIMPAERSVDIDTLLDFELAEFLLRRNST